MGPTLNVTELVWAFQAGEPPFLRVPEFTVGEGKMAAVLGPSGAGKSTLLFLLAGLEVPADGTILWGDYDMARDRPGTRDRWRRQNLGLVFQDFQLVPELTALENILLPLTFGRFSIPPEDKRRARSLLDQMGVDRPEARAATLSRGEMQRTALARALLGRPPIVLADEPTASLDSHTEAAVVGLLTEYRRELGATVVVSTHHQALSDSADLQIRLNHGTAEKRPS